MSNKNRNSKTGRYEKSENFYDWCIKNNHYDYIELWNNELNKDNIHDVGYRSPKQYFFNCGLGKHEPESKCLSNLTNRNHLTCNKCNSFAQWGIDNLSEDFLEKYWDYDKNTVDPWLISFGSNNIHVWIKCQEKEYHGSYEVKPNNFVAGNRCGFCITNGKKVHPLDSFAQYHINNTDPEFLYKYWDWEQNNRNHINPWTIMPCSNKFRIWIICQEKDYHGSYEVLANAFTSNKRCPLCSSNSGKVHKLDSLATIRPEVLLIWSDKNNKSPYEYACHTAREVWFKCENNKHPDYKRSVVGSFESDFRCSKCVRERKESILQETVRLYLENTYSYTLKHELDCSIVPLNPKCNNKKGRMPFDIEIQELRLIIEVHGEQHYTKKYFEYKYSDKITPEQQLHKRKLYDRYKKYVAIINGYHYLEIPYWSVYNETYKQLIENKINYILNQKECVA